MSEERATLLIVDDDVSSRTILKSIFSGRYNFLEAANGTQALDVLRRGNLPDLVILDLNMPDVDGYDVLEEIKDDPAYRHIPFIVITADNASATRTKALSLGALEILTKPYHPDSILLRVNNILSSIEATKHKIAEQLKTQLTSSAATTSTEVWGKSEFTEAVSKYLSLHPNDHFLIARWDIDHFKLFNESFGIEAGDDLLRSIGERFAESVERFQDRGPIFYARWEADHFVSLWNENNFKPDKIYRYTLLQLESCFDGFDFSIRYGFYKITDSSLAVATMCDRAHLALRAAKQQYDIHYMWYEDSMRSRLIEEQELASSMKQALRCGEFVPYYQPQYNYDSGKLIGAEALVRWVSPEKGLISPGAFIPLFEKNGFITELDFYIWEYVCRQIREWINSGLQPPPISVNMSRRDLYTPSLVNRIIGLVDKYNISPSLLHLEITESAYMDNPDQMLEIVEQLQANGFHIEMDDFGSGYSSLNTLKDVSVDMLKLDMKFVAESADNSRGGSILSSVVHMAHAINLPVIAEGVETKQQADYLKTVNCLYMQGYYFAKPMPEADFTELIKKDSSGYEADEKFSPAFDNTVDFLDGSTQATLLFNSFIGGAGIIEYENKLATVLRLNDRFFEEIRIPRELFCKSDPNIIKYLDAPSKTVAIDTIELAIRTNAETCCEVCFVPETKGFEKQWVEVRFRYLAKKFSSCIVYFTLTNKTSDKKLQVALTESMNRTDEILRFVPGGIAEFEVCERALNRVYLSESAADILGYDIVKHKTVNILTHTRNVNPDDRKIIVKKMRSAIEAKKPFSVDARVRTASGASRWVNLTANPIESNGKLKYFGIYTNITRKKAVEAVREIEKVEHNIAATTDGGILLGAWMCYCKSTPDLVFVKDLNSNYICCSEKFAEYSGFHSADELIGLSDYDVTDDAEKASRYIQSDLQVISTGRPLENLVEPMILPNGESHLSSSSKYPIFNADGQVIGVYCVTRDISSSHLLEEYKLALNSSGKHIFRYTVNDRAFHDVEEIDGKVAPINFVDAPEQVVKRGIIAKGQENNWLKLFESIDAGERCGVSDIRFLESDGEYQWYRVSFKSVLDENGKPSSAIISYRNVESYHTLERDKNIEKTCVYAAINALYPVYIASNLTRNLTKAYYNNSNCHLCNESAFDTYDEALELHAKFLHEKDRKRYFEIYGRENLITRFTNQEESFSETFFHLCKDGKFRRTEISLIPTHDPESGDLLCVGLMKILE